MDVDVPALRTTTILSDLARDCLLQLASMLNRTQQLALLACGNKLLSIKWADAFSELHCVTGEWRTLAIETRMGGKGGRKKIKVCLFARLQSLTLDMWDRGKRHQPLNKKQLQLLPPGLTYLSVALKKDTCDVVWPATIIKLSLSNLPETFDPLYRFPTSIMSLILKYNDGHTCMPKHLQVMQTLRFLGFESSRPLASKQVATIPSSLKKLVLKSCFLDQAALVTVGQVLTKLTSISCHHVFYQPPGMRPMVADPDLSVLPPSITHLSKAFKSEIRQREEWSRYPRNLLSFGDEYIIVYGDTPMLHQYQFQSKQRLMHEIPPFYQLLRLVVVTEPCPLRFVTHLQLCAFGSHRPLISQAQIEACRDMASVTHLEMQDFLDHSSGLIDLQVCSWRLTSLKINYSAQVIKDTLYLDDYAPWVTDSLLSLYICCGVLIAQQLSELPSSIQSLHIRVHGDKEATVSQVSAELLSYVDFMPL